MATNLKPMNVKNVLPVKLSEIGLGDMDWQLSGIDNVPITYKEVEYFPISMAFIPQDLFMIYNNEFCFVSGAKRIQADYIKANLLELLKAEFPGEYQLVSGRYLFKFNNLNGVLLDRIIKACKDGDGSVIDYSWIAPLQELKFIYELGEKRGKKPIPTRKIRNDAPSLPNSWRSATITGYKSIWKAAGIKLE